MAPNRRRSCKEVMKTRISRVKRSANPMSSQIVTRRQKLMTVSANGTFKIPELLVIRKTKTKSATRKNNNTKAGEAESEKLAKSIIDTTESVIKEVISNFTLVPSTDEKELIVQSSSPPTKVTPRKSLRSTIVPTMLNIISATKTARKKRPRIFSAKRKQQTKIVDSQIPKTYDNSDSDIMTENDKNLDNFSGKKIVVSLKKENSVVIVAYSDENKAKPTKTQKIWKIARKSTGGIPKHSSYYNSHSNNNTNQNITV